jgi:hypothetical protein
MSHVRGPLLEARGLKITLAEFVWLSRLCAVAGWSHAGSGDHSCLDVYGSGWSFPCSGDHGCLAYAVEIVSQAAISA